MYRRRVLFLLLTALIGAAAGCSTFSDNDAAARVGDVELSQDELDALLVAATPGALPGEQLELAGDTARELLNTWILTRIIEQDVADNGETVDSAATAEATSALEASDPDRWATTPEVIQDLQIEQQAAIATWQTLEVPVPTDAEVRELYGAGTAESGIVCSAHILVETEAEAVALLERLAGGADFAELAASESIDTGSGADGGNLPCALTPNFQGSYVPEFVEAAMAAELGVPVGPVRSQFGYHLIVLRSPEAVDPSELAPLYNELSQRFRRAADRLDIYVDPRFGSFNPTTGVVALG